MKKWIIFIIFLLILSPVKALDVVADSGYWQDIQSLDMSFDYEIPIDSITYNSSRDSVSILMEVGDSWNIVIESDKIPTSILKNGTYIDSVSDFGSLDLNKYYYDYSTNKLFINFDRFLLGSKPLFGNSLIGGSDEGYTPWIYTAGPYQVTETMTVNSIFFYTPTTGNARVGLYDSTPTGSGWPDGWSHPNNLLTESNEVSCEADSWCEFDITDTQIGSGDYFLALQMDTNGMLSGTGRMWFGQYVTHTYSDPFPNPFGQPDNIGETGAEYSAYACCG